MSWGRHEFLILIVFVIEPLVEAEASVLDNDYDNEYECDYDDDGKLNGIERNTLL
jgi:hypothetical protein